jgi:hypothetical protein
MTKEYTGVLEVDENTGVVYFHLSPLALENADLSDITTVTMLRIQGLRSSEVPSPQHQLDLNISALLGR